MAVLGGAALLLGLLPLAVGRRAGGVGGGRQGGGAARAVAAVLPFGGGALLASVFLHLLPEVREAVEELQQSGKLPEAVPHLPELLVCAGFFSMLLLEQVMHASLHRRRRTGSSNRLQCSRDDDSCPPRVADKPEDIEANGTSTARIPLNEISQMVDEAVGLLEKMKSFSGTEPPESPEVHQAVPEQTVAPHVTSQRQQQAPPQRPDAADASGDRQHQQGEDTEAQHFHVHLPAAQGSTLGALAFVLALSVHEAFEGVAVGLQETPTEVYYLTAAVAAHKLVLALCSGVQLASSGSRLRAAVAYLLVFAIVSPAGIGVGLALEAEEGAEVGTSVATAALQGVAAGTLVYVCFHEILSRHTVGLRQCASAALGFCVMALLLWTTSHDHGEGCGAAPATTDAHVSRWLGGP